VDIKLGTTFTLFQPGRKRLNPSYFLCVFRDTDANETRQAITQSIGDAVGPLLLELTEGTSDPLDGVVQLYSGDWVLTVYEQTSATNLDAANADRNVWTELVRVSAQCDADPGPEPYDPCEGCVEVATTVNGEESDTPTITVLQGGIEVGTLNPATGVVTIDECPEGCTDPYTIKWDVDGTEITILVDEDPCGGEAVLSCDTVIDAVVVEGAGSEDVNGLYPMSIRTENFVRFAREGNNSVDWEIAGEDATLPEIHNIDNEVVYQGDVFPSSLQTSAVAEITWSVFNGVAPAPTVRQATIGDLCGGEPVPCEDASVTWDGEPLLTIPSGGTQDLDCNTLVNAAYAVDGGSVTGTYKPDGTLNSREVFRLDVSHNFQYTGTRWRLVKPGSDYDAALGSETKPWDADWSATPVTVTQATIGAYCDDCEPCEPVTIQLQDSAANPIGSPDVYTAGTTTTKTAPDGTFQRKDSAGTDIGSPIAVRSNQTGVVATCPDATITVNSTAFDNALSNGSLDVPVKDTLGASVGSKIGSDWIVPAVITGDPIIYAFGRQLHSGQTTSFRTGDEGDMLASGWFNYAPTLGQNSVLQSRTNWNTLAHNNVFGNTNRFTNASGGAFATSGDRMFIDHLTGIMWFAFNAFVASRTWNQSIDDAVAHSFGGFTDWRLPPIQVIQSVTQRNGNTLQYGPFNITGTAFHRTSSTAPTATTNDYGLNSINQGAVAVTTAKTASSAGIGYQLFVRRWIP
jgi:hypothetical protein